MEILIGLDSLSRRFDKPFIVIGGHALNAHGILRNTHDIDLMIRRDDGEFWLAQLISIGYAAFNRTDAFIQLKGPSITSWPIDLMLVDDATFSKALAQSSVESHGQIKLATASVAHLIAMKLNALKNEMIHRYKKDESDLLQLLDIANIPLVSDKFRQLCQKYGTIELYERLAGEK